MSKNDPTVLTAAEVAERIAAGTFSSEDYTGACLARIAAREATIHAFAHLDPDHALAQARARDAQRREGRPLGPLHGVPVAIKDIFDTADYPAEYGSPLLKGRRPMQDAAAVARLRAAGAVIIGKTVTTEFAYFEPGPTRNPHDPARTPGGSSSGSAAAVAAGMVPLAIGSQTAGSIIRPAAFCGIYGLKPTHGTISRARALIISRTLDHVGVFARSIRDCALLLGALAGYDPEDPDTRPIAVPDFVGTAMAAPPRPPRLAFVRTPAWNKAEPGTRAAFETLAARLGKTVAPVDLPDVFDGALADQRAVMAVEMAHNLEAMSARSEASSQALRDLLAEGRNVSAVRYLAAREAAKRYAATLADILSRYDAILTPATLGVAPKGMATGDPAFCALWTLTGLPAVSLPLLTGEAGMPLGVQLVGARGDDGRLLRTARWLATTMESERTLAGVIERR